MKNQKFLNTLLLFSLFLFIRCTTNTNDPAFLQQVEGRYLYSPDETVLVYAKDNFLMLNWRGATDIKPSKLNEDTFYVKEMNAKIQFLTNSQDQKMYLVFLPKNKEDRIEYIHRKMDVDEKIPSEYLDDGDYQKALEGYLAIKANDSMSPLLRFRTFDRQGLRYLRNDSIDVAIEIFKMNAVLHPQEPDVYARLGNVYLDSKDTVNALTNYKKALEFDSGNRHLKRKINELKKKEVENTN